MKVKNKILLVLAVLFCACITVFAVACNGGSVNYTFEEYSFNTGTGEESDWRELDYPDEEIEMDGVVDETAYGTTYLSITDVNGVNMKVYAYMGQEGVFFGFVSDDTNVYYNEDREVYNNTSVEIQVAPAGTEDLTANVVQLRVGVNGYAEQWIGLYSIDSTNGSTYDYTRKSIPSMGAVHINGELNSSDCDGYSIEIYMPYTSLNIEEGVKPDSIVCAPSFNTRVNYSATSRATWTMMLGCDLSNPASWYAVDSTGITTHTGGMEMQQDGTTVEQTAGSNQFYYFDTEPQTAYYFETTMTVKDFLNNDGFPKFGLVNRSEEELLFYHVDAAGGTGTNFGKVLARQSTNTGTAWDWDSSSVSMSGASSASRWGDAYISGYDGVKFGVLYLDGTVYMLLDDVLVYTEHDFAVGEGAVPGLITFNTEMTFASCEYIADEAEVRALAEDILPAEVSVDGDISDWESLANWSSIESNSLYAEDADDSEGKNMTVYAFLGSDGLYIAYDVNHLTDLANTKWGDGWWLNTNIEFFIGGSGNDNQFALTDFANGGYLDAVMTTTGSSSDGYHTVAEIFVPIDAIQAYREEAEVTSVAVGFAFKAETSSSDEACQLNGNSYWYFGSEQPSACAYTVTADGILTETPVTSVTISGGNSVEEGGELRLTATVSPVNADYDSIVWESSNDSYATVEDGVVTGVAAGQVTITATAGGVTSEPFTVTVTAASGTPVTSVTLSEESLALDVGDEQTLTVTLAPENATNQTVTWTSEDQTVATVDDNGKVTAVGVGTTTITATAHKGLSDSCTVPVSQRITLDGSLDDWTGIKSVGAQGQTEADSYKSVTFYGYLTDSGLYLAADAYHDVYTYGQGQWHQNTNFELFVGSSSTQLYAYATGANTFGVSRTGMEVAVTSVSLSGADEANYHTIVELFILTSILNDVGYTEADGYVRVGVAWKTNNDTMTGGGAGAYNAGDTWWTPYGAYPNNEYRCYATAEGIYTPLEYNNPDMQFGADTVTAETPVITVDGELTEWTDVKPLSVTGTDTYEGKSATWYAVLTKAGLYLAVDAHYGTHTYGQNDWWLNSNFEFFVGEWSGGTPRQCYIYATGATTWAASHTYLTFTAKTTGDAENGYHTVIEAFIPMENLADYDLTIQDGAVRVGVAWKTAGDEINNTNDGDGTSEYWVPQGCRPNNAEMCYVTSAGIYTPSEYDALNAA